VKVEQIPRERSSVARVRRPRTSDVRSSVPQSEGCSFKHLYGNWTAKFPKNLRKREKIYESSSGAF
jgi:hypothetical protein